MRRLDQQDSTYRSVRVRTDSFVVYCFSSLKIHSKYKIHLRIHQSVQKRKEENNKSISLSVIMICRDGSLIIGNSSRGAMGRPLNIFWVFVILINRYFIFYSHFSSWFTILGHFLSPKPEWKVSQGSTTETFTFYKSVSDKWKSLWRGGIE